MKKFLRNIYDYLLLFGFDPVKTLQTVRLFPFFFKDLKEYKRQSSSIKTPFIFGKQYICLHDRNQPSGNIRGHYFYQDLLVAKKIFEGAPKVHVDIGSRIDGFVAHVATFMDIEVFDYRLINCEIKNIKFKQVDITIPIEKSYEEYCESLSCLHALEHFGLGRYGDPVKIDGYIIALDNLYKILKHGGKLYLSVPIGPSRVEFNAHRVFSISLLLDLFDKKFDINSFSYIDDSGFLHENVQLVDKEIINNYGCNYGCGIFELEKLTI